MPAKDVYHNHVVSALRKDGWDITHDPYVLKWGKKDLFVDLGAEKIIAAEKIGEKIAIEVKSFVGPSELEELKSALGQYILYKDIMHRTEPDRKVFLAIRDSVFNDIFEEPIGLLILETQKVPLIVFDPNTEEIIKWVE